MDPVRFTQVWLPLSGRFYSFIAVIADVESRAIEMTTVLRGITIMTTKTLHIILGPKHTGDNNLMQGNALHRQAVEIAAAYIL